MGVKTTSQIRLGRTKATMVTKNVLGADEQAKTVRAMKENPFSLIIDESTDLGCIKSLAGVVRMVNDKMQTNDIFCLLKEVEDASSDGLFKIIFGKLYYLLSILRLNNTANMIVPSQIFFASMTSHLATWLDLRRMVPT